MNDLQTLTNGDTGYVAKHNANYAAIKAAIDGLESSLGASFGSALSTAEAFAALFGPQIAVLGSTSYETSTAGAVLTVGAGYAWLPGDSLVVGNEADATLDFTGVAAATYYVVIDTTGTPSRSTGSTNALHSVVWSGAAFGTITRIAAIVWTAEDWTAAQISAALGASYASLDARLEAGEAVAVAAAAELTAAHSSAALGASYGSLDARLEAGEAVAVAAAATAAEVVAARDSATNGPYASLDARLEDIESTLGGVGGGDVVGPGVSVDGHLAQFDGTTGKLLKDGGLAVDTDTTLAADSDTRIATQKAVKAYADGILGPTTGTGSLVRADSATLTGRVGMGVAANSNWVPSDTSWQFLDFKYGSISAGTNVSGPCHGLFLAFNAYVFSATGPTGVWKYKSDGVAVRYVQRMGGHQFSTAVSGLADGVATWTTQLTIDSNGTYGAAGAPSMTTGFISMPAADGPPTGVPTITSTYAPLYYDRTARVLYAWNTSTLIWENVALASQPFDLTGFYPGLPSASAKVVRVPIARAVTFPANFANSVGTASANATASTAFDVQKNGASVGTMTFAGGASSATFTSSGGAAVSFAAGDVLMVVAPATPDATLADVGLVLAGTR